MSPLWVQLAVWSSAPALSALLLRRVRTAAFVDGATQILLVGILVLHVVPEGLVTGGWPALIALLAGFVAGVSTHHLPGGARATAVAAGVGLAVHGLLDGAAMRADADGLLAWSVVLHSLPFGLATWRMAAARDVRLAAGLLASTAGFTVLGWSASGWVLEGSPAGVWSTLQCGLAGTLLHVVGHAPAARQRPWDGLGGLLGVALVGLLVVTDPLPAPLGAGPDTLRTGFGLLARSAPVLLAGYAAVGLLHVFGPRSLASRLVGRTSVAAAARGALVGLPVPTCSCGALPEYRSLVAEGAPPAAALAFLVAGPEIGLPTLAISASLLGWPLTGVRVGTAVAVAVLTGLLVGRWVQPRPGPPPAPVHPPEPMAHRWRDAVAYARETADHTAPWVVAGLLLAALVEPQLSDGALPRVPAGLTVALAALAGVPAYVCASGATPLAAVLLHKGLGAGAMVAFLLTGPATNLTTFGILRRLHGPRVAWAYGLSVTAAAIAAGWALTAVADVAPPDLHRLLSGSPGPIGTVAAGALAMMWLEALVRNGPVGFVEPMLHPHHDHSPEARHPSVELPRADTAAPVLRIGAWKPRPR